MKEAVIVGLDGIYAESVIVPLSEKGVTEIYETPEPPEREEGEEPETPESVLVGYRVAVPVPQGLYMPRWDIASWQEERDNSPDPVSVSAFWVEGLTQEELDEINPPITIDQVKQNKIEELRAARDAALYAGFVSVINDVDVYFGFDPIDQAYLIEKALLMSIDTSVMSTDWKVSDGTDYYMMTLTREQFFQVVRDGGAFKEQLVRDLMYLEATVLNCEDETSVQAIVW